MVSFEKQVFNHDKSLIYHQFVLLSFIDHAFGVAPNPRSQNFFPCSLLKNLIAFGFKFKLMIHSELSFESGLRY